MHASNDWSDITTSAGSTNDRAEFETEPAADGTHEFVSDLDAAFYFKPANRRHLSDAPIMVSNKIRAYKSSFGVLGVLAGIMLGVEWVSEFSIITPILNFIAGYIDTVAQLDVPSYFAAALAATIFVLVALILVREDSFRRRQQMSSEQYALTVGTTHDGLWIWDIVKDQEYFSPRWGQIL